MFPCLLLLPLRILLRQAVAPSSFLLPSLLYAHLSVLLSPRPHGSPRSALLQRNATLLSSSLDLINRASTSSPNCFVISDPALSVSVSLSLRECALTTALLPCSAAPVDPCTAKSARLETGEARIDTDREKRERPTSYRSSSSSPVGFSFGRYPLDRRIITPTASFYKDVLSCISGGGQPHLLRVGSLVDLDGFKAKVSLTSLRWMCVLTYRPNYPCCA